MTLIAVARPDKAYFTVHFDSCGKVARSVHRTARWDAKAVSCGNCRPDGDLASVPVARAPRPPAPRIPDPSGGRRLADRLARQERARLARMWADTRPPGRRETDA